VKLLKSLQAILKSCCVIGKEPQLKKINQDLEKLENHVNGKIALLNGENSWFLTMQAKHKEGKSS